ncbi:hypothetical protein CspHIS471_0704950 [Cutaneotrichosporon sp. HIS471]|nr:hypothetical protein CspHIS471_0704950 [Cutaneotrichosporon sp. HIS471]
MARETRGSAAREAASHPNASPDSGSKRKRRTSEASAPTDTNGETPDSKRLRTNGKVEPIEEEPEPARPGRLLTAQIREAISVIVSQMASGLPHPINGILTLALPPDFSQKEENTLGWILRQDSLTWEKLVSIIHLFAEHLLLPASYPNPIPSLDRFHLPVPPLPSHFSPMAVYTFCRGLYALLLQVEEQIGGSTTDVKPAERWALMQKTPGHGLGTAGGDWFTAVADLREVEAARKRLGIKNGETLLSNLAAGDKKFGAAQPLIVQATEPLGQGKGKVPSLSESLIRRASLKAQRWKESHAARRKSGFGSVLHEVTPVAQNTAWTPTFGPSYDSSNAQGLGYYSTLHLMHERRRRHLHAEVTANIIAIDEDDGWYGTLEMGDKKNKPAEEDKINTANGEKVGEAKEDADAVLSANAERIDELKKWQEVRVVRGDVEWVSDRERAVADELFASLARLIEASDTPPSALLLEQKGGEKTDSEKKSVGLAHKLARRLLANRAPIIRGTLDPRRPLALHDNVTLRLRAQTAAAITAPAPHTINGAPHAPPPKAGGPGTTGFMPPPSSTIREPPPHTMPNNIGIGRFYPPQGRSPYPTPQQQLQKSPHQPHQPLTPQQHHQALPQHQGMQHPGMQQHHAMQQQMQAQAQQAMQMGLQLTQHQMPMVAGGSPAHAHMRMMGMMPQGVPQGVPQGMPQGGMQGGMQGMQMPQQFGHGSPPQQMFRPQGGMMHPQQHPQQHTQQHPQQQQMQQQMQFRPMPGMNSPSPAGMAYPQQRVMAVPSGLRQPYPMQGTPGAPGTPGTPGAMGAMPVLYQPGYGSPMPGRVGMPGGAVPMMGQMQGMPGQQVMHR